MSPNGLIAQYEYVTANLDANGNFSPNLSLWGCDQLTPNTGLYYTARIYNSGQGLVRGPERWVISGTSPINAANIIPTGP